jgi:hypothetical protein
VIGANVQDVNSLSRCNSKLRIISSKDVPAGGARGFEPPATFGATKTPKTLLLNPYQLPVHGRLLVSAVKPSPSLGAAEDAQSERWAKCTCANSDGLSGILHMTEKRFVRGNV